MRKFKFRAYSPIDKVMIYDLNSPIISHGEIIANEHDILMQWTGLKDKRDIDIYEGDLIQFEWRKQQGESKGIYCAQVKFKKGAFVFDFLGFSKLLSDLNTDGSLLWKETYHVHGSDEYYELINIEVIGNIYKNPELCPEDEKTE